MIETTPALRRIPPEKACVKSFRRRSRRSRPKRRSGRPRSGRELGPAFRPPRAEDPPSRLGGHPRPEAVAPLAFEVARLKCAFHRTVIRPGESPPETWPDARTKGGESTGAFREVSIGSFRLAVPSIRYTLAPLPRKSAGTEKGRSAGEVNATAWQRCIDRLEGDVAPEAFNTYVRPLQAVEDGTTLRLLAPNSFIRDWVDEYLFETIEAFIHQHESAETKIVVQVGSRTTPASANGGAEETAATADARTERRPLTTLNPDFTFENFIEGNSNRMARAAAMHVASNPGDEYNPLFIYGGTALGKTHLMHAIGHRVSKVYGGGNIACLSAESFFRDMVRAIQRKTTDYFKEYYRSVDTLLIDDVQFLARKERSQDEFFHMYNVLIERERPLVMTCDRYPKEIEGLEERLKSRFGSGLAVSIEPPDLETRAAILMSKAAATDTVVPEDVAHFIARGIRSNVRDLQGALNRVIATSKFTGRAVTVDLAMEALQDILALQERLVTIENIQRTVAQHYRIKVTDLVSKKRTRAIARARQIAMALAKEMTNQSLPEIGKAFGGRDHTTVLHARRKIAELCGKDITIKDDYALLMRTLTA